MAYIRGKKGDPRTGKGFQRGIDTQEELWKLADLTERRKAALLPTLLGVALEAMNRKAGAELRDDAKMQLAKAAALPWTGYPIEAAMESQKSLGSVAKSMLDGANPEDEAEAVLAASALIMKLADERRMPGQDYENPALVLALSIMIEAQENPEVGWGFNPDRAPKMINGMLDRANLAGVPLM